MVSKDIVGARFRQIRTAQRKTLKDVEAVSGFSSTHISEIERGRTSPTVGALVRIAHALNKDPSFFIEERELEEVCVTTTDDRSPLPRLLEMKGSGFRANGLSRGILGGRLLSGEIDLDPGGDVRLAQPPRTGDMCVICLSGSCVVDIGGKTSRLDTESTIHVSFDDAEWSLRAPDTACRLLLIVDPKEAVG